PDRRAGSRMGSGTEDAASRRTGFAPLPAEDTRTDDAVTHSLASPTEEFLQAGADMVERAAQTALVVGALVGHFRIRGLLGRGGMGVVYRAEDETLRREVALKVLPPFHVHDVERRRRLLREARAAAAVNHPNIATVYEVGEAEGRVYIAMELI